MSKGNERIDVRNQRLAMVLLICTVFFGAILLFSMEPLVGRLLTPYFGGAAHVWLICLMFFQAMLFLGYLYAHLLVRKLGSWHLFFLVIPLASLPLQIGANPDPGAPLLAILATLVFYAALPFIALSTTAVVAQTWLASSPAGKNREPYPLYAASNAGSLLALLGYAFLIEPLSGLRAQSLFWSGAYVVYVLLVLATWLQLRPDKGCRKNPGRGMETATPQPPGLIVYGQWLLLSALPSAFLLATTNYITLEIGSFPFVWVIPLALYLGSFIATFRIGGGVPGSLNILWIEVLLMAFFMYVGGGVSGWLAILGHLVLFFAICLVAHGNLYKRRPAAHYLTNFYLASAVGGCFGGIMVSLVAPFLFTGLFEYPVLLCLFAVTFSWCHYKDFFAFWRRVSFLEGGVRLVLVGIIVALVTVYGYKTSQEPTKFRHRNFYGAYRVDDESSRPAMPGGLRRLWHGRTVHGAQLLRPDLHAVPTLYYCLGSGISDVFQTTPSPRRIGIIGLGSGVVSVYAEPNDMVTYFEIDPDVEKIARQWFTYLDDCRGRVRILTGDGRLLMQSGSGTNEYDVILVDAFAGDGIPTHLLTREAMEIYLSHLSPSGVMVFHVSNRFYDLRPVLKAIAAGLKLPGAMKEIDRTSLEPYQAPSKYVALTRPSGRLEPLLQRGWKQFGSGDGLKETKEWTDDYINIIGPLMDNVGKKNPFVQIAGRLKQPFK